MLKLVILPLVVVFCHGVPSTDRGISNLRGFTTPARTQNFAPFQPPEAKLDPRYGHPPVSVFYIVRSEWGFEAMLRYSNKYLSVSSEVIQLASTYLNRSWGVIGSELHGLIEHVIVIEDIACWHVIFYERAGGQYLTGQYFGGARYSMEEPFGPYCISVAFDTLEELPGGQLSKLKGNFYGILVPSRWESGR